MKTSVALCTYNGEKYLQEQLDSILCQTQKVDEIIVCDDRSSDGTVSILEEYSKKHSGLFKIFINEENLRSVKNFEKAISLCSGEVIFLSDQDDKWTENKVENYVSFFKNNPQIKVIASNGDCINEKSEVLDKYTIWEVPQFLRENNIPFDYYSLLTEVGNFATGASMAIKKEIISEIIPFPIVKDFHHDEWIAIIACKNNAFEMLHEKYFLYRVHAAQQVGGVCYDKTKKQKKSLIENYNIQNINTFLGYKRRLKKLKFNLLKNIDLSKKTTVHKAIFEENSETIKLKFLQTKKTFKLKYPIRSRLLSISDAILGKRRL